MRKSRLVVACCVLLSLILSGVSVMAQDSAIPQISVQASAEGFAMAGEVPEGAVTLSIENTAEMPVVTDIIMLAEGETMETFMATMMTLENPEAMFTTQTLLGGTFVMPGSTGTLTYWFAPGNYLLLNLAADEPIFQPFTVADGEGEGAAAPEATLEIELVDFAFVLPIEMSAGEQMWHITNAGEQWHELGMVRLDENSTLAEFHEFVFSTEEDETTIPDFLLLPMSPGNSVWVTMNLEPGTYGIACFLPDIMGEGHEHFRKGMVQIITVTAAQ